MIMSSTPDSTSSNPPRQLRPPTGSGPIDMIKSAAEQIAEESGLDCVADIQDLAIITYLGLLDSPPPDPPSRDQLLQACRRGLIIWAWEQGREGEDLPITRPAPPPIPLPDDRPPRPRSLD